MLNYLFVELQMIDATTAAAAAQHIEETNIKTLKVSDRTKIERYQGQTTKRTNERASDELATNREDDYLFCSCRVLVLGWFFFFSLRILGVGPLCTC